VGCIERKDEGIDKQTGEMSHLRRWRIAQNESIGKENEEPDVDRGAEGRSKRNMSSKKTLLGENP